MKTATKEPLTLEETQLLAVMYLGAHDLLEDMGAPCTFGDPCTGRQLARRAIDAYKSKESQWRT